MAEAGNKNNYIWEERGLNARAVQASKTAINTKARIESRHKNTIRKQIVDIKAPGENQKAEKTKKIEQTGRPTQIDAFAEFEMMRISPVKKSSSRIILRDVERVPASKNIHKKSVKTETRKEPLPPVFKNVTKIVDSTPKLSAKAMKEQEIEKAVKKAGKLPVSDAGKSSKHSMFGKFGWTRAILAIACAATTIFAVVYFVNLTSNDMSIKVAAMQSGIDAKYPSYIPRGYNLSDVTSINGKVIMHFKDGENEYGITEESSNWDSSALLNEYVKTTYGDSYVVVREQGLTLYMGDNWEAWVNGGTLYKLTVSSGALTKKQMKSIAVSL